MDSADPVDSEGFRLFDADEMLGYLGELDSLLEREGATESVHLYIAGGAVMSTKSANRVTHDIDVVSEGMTDDVRLAADLISRRHTGLRPDWLNDGAKLKRVNIPMEASRIYSGRVLTVDSAGSRYILAMKLISGRPVDESDCEQLIRELGIREESEILDLIEQAIPERLRKPGMEYFALDRLARARKGKWLLRFREWRSRRTAHSTRTRAAATESGSVSTSEAIVARARSKSMTTPSRYCNALLPSGTRCRNPRPRQGTCSAGHWPA
ncbi:hypothetical protein [Candidatus Poriferisodalis sp.]|uniref:hypothetical protein n=1 Tax=Candidatus Poriferisodalis sp. TaxID=3101277 RepID=UPI003B01FB45